jgi:flagellar biosynthesis/type III secretory pathway protein FliH
MRRLSAQAFETSAATQVWSSLDDFEPRDMPQNASEPAQAAYKQGYLEGFDAGYADGDKEARSALEEEQARACAAVEAARIEKDSWRAQLESLCERFAKAQQDVYVKSEALAVALAYTSVCRVVEQGYAKEDLVAALCRDALEHLSAVPTQLRIAPSDYESLQKVGLAMPIIEDPALHPGDCVIVTPLEEIETGIAFRLQALLQTLLETLGNGGHSS